MNSTGIIYLVIALVIIISSLVALWFLSKKTPRGTVLGISIFIYILGRSITPGDCRELYIVKGSMQMIGFLGGILGFVDLFRKK